jgi:hypothetical protein
VRYFLGEGYALEKQIDDYALLVYARGSRSSLRIDEHRHKLELSADGNKLHFDFHTATGSSGMVTKQEREALEARADAAAAAAADPPPPPPIIDTSDQFHCRYCSGLTPSTEPNCRHCGAENFS